MFDHLGLTVADPRRSRDFYAQLLLPLGYGLQKEVTRDQTGGYEGVAFGPPQRPLFWLGSGEAPAAGAHVAFSARTREQVDAFHAAGLAAGGRDNGAPGVRAHYHPNYYGAFVIDPDGNNVEAVCHAAP